MPDTTHPPPQRVPARDAFCALPQERPQRSAWPAVAAQLKRRPRRGRRAPLWWAVAASAVLVALLIPRLQPTAPGDPGRPATTRVAATEYDPGLDALVQRSRALESRLQGMPPALRSASAVLAAQWIAADIGAIDAALAQARPEEAATLWQARVVLLTELAGLQHSEAVAATGAGDLMLALD